MGARALEARLTQRLVALGGSVLVAVGVAALVVTWRVLDAGDTDAARSRAIGAQESLARELGEGDPLAEALAEVIGEAQTSGVRLRVRVGATAAGASSLPALAPGTCTATTDADGAPWRVCAAGDGASSVVAAIPVGAHAAAIRALGRGMFVIVGVALLAMWLAVRRALRSPLLELAALVRWTTEIDEVERVLPPPSSGTEEISRLVTAFEALVGRLLVALARERANGAHIAHELRTPLTSIVTELELVRAGYPGAKPAIDRVLADVARFGDVIDAILALSGPPDLRADTVVNLADVARALAPVGARVEAPDEALVEVDERMVRLALRNLLENATKYAAGVRIVRLTRAGAGVRVAVIDDGPGLSAAARAHMFDRYWRGSADGPGRGLGLALVRAVAERHGGRAEARPGADGRGLEVSMTFDRLAGWHEQAP